MKRKKRIQNYFSVMLIVTMLLSMLPLGSIGIATENVYADEISPLTFTAGLNDSTVALAWIEGSNIQYKLGEGEWQDYQEVESDYCDHQGQTITLTNQGDSVSFRGINVKTYDLIGFTMTGEISASGDVTSLTNGIGGDTALSESCYFGMFEDCTSLMSAPNLPSTELADYCYDSMFAGCTSLIDAPQLPATELKDGCYSGMFSNCTMLFWLPKLPATEMKDGCYQYMFSGCTNLDYCPALPSMNLARSCYSGMFSGCTNLDYQPMLPATELADYCYRYMFSGCTKLNEFPQLPATELANYCYEGMYCDCTKLSCAINLPATKLAKGCYSSMFSHCTSLKKCPQLPVTELADYCYSDMFSYCTNLTECPKLPATELTDHCYSNMFYGCTKLTECPELPATELADYCYANMFSGGTGLSKLPVLSAKNLANYCYSGMFSGCSNIWLTETNAGTEWSIPEDAVTAQNWGSNMFKNTKGSIVTPQPGTVYYLRSADSVLSLQKINYVENRKDLNAIVNAINTSVQGEYRIELKADINCLSTITFNNPNTTINLIGNGHSLTFRKSGSQGIYVYGATLNLGQKGVNNELTIKSVRAENDEPGLLYITNKATVNMYDGVTITGHVCNNYTGGGVTVFKNGTFNMLGGEISKCGIRGGSVCFGGGLAVVGDNAEATISGGKITGNFVEASENYDYATSSTGLYSLAGGGGIAVIAHGNLTITGGEIVGNQSVRGAGGGIAAYDSKLIIKGGTISSNTADQFGGGIYVTRTSASCASIAFDAVTADVTKLSYTTPVSSKVSQYTSSGKISSSLPRLMSMPKGYGLGNAHIENAEITDNKVTGSYGQGQAFGGGIAAIGYNSKQLSQLYIDGCKILRNSVSGTGSVGGGIGLCSNVILNLGNSDIKYNQVSGCKGGGIYYGVSVECMVSGSLHVLDNLAVKNTKTIISNLYIPYGESGINYLEVSSLTSGAKIGITDPQVLENGTSAGRLTNYYASSCRNIMPYTYFTSDDSSWTLYLKDGELALKK